MSSAMTTLKGLNIATYIGPFLRNAHLYTTLLDDATNIAYKRTATKLKFAYNYILSYLIILKFKQTIKLPT